MRILYVVHDFLPHHVAGVEVYTDQLAGALSREHDVSIVYSEVVPEAPDHSVRRGRRGRVALYEIVNNHRFRRFAETWSNPAVERAFRGVLDEVRPDVVHVQHLLNLSLGIFEELSRRGIPVLMTLHDHWLACANGGQRFHPELGRCEVLDARRCGACTAHMNGMGLRLGGLLRRRASGSADPGGLDLTRMRPRVRTSDSAFVYRDAYVLRGEPEPTWVAHPPSRLEFALRLRSAATFRASAAMHPDTFAAEGGGVRFRVFVDREPVWERVLDPKRREADRTPCALEVELAPGRHELALCTEAVPEDESAFCTAGWIAPRILGAGGGRPPLAAPLAAGLDAARRAAGAAAARVQSRRIEQRWSEVRRLATKVDLFVAPSRYLGEEMAAFGLPAERILHSDYGFVTDRFTRRADLPERARRFAYIGSLVPHKGVHVLVEAFGRMPDDAILEIFGAPHYHPAYSRRLAETARHPGIRFRGGLDPESVPKALSEVDALVVPSIWFENSPLTIHEAFLAGVPVVASRLGGNVDLLASGGGLLYDATDPDALREALERLYAEPGLGRRLADGAPRVKPMDEHVEELLGLYRQLRCQRPAD